MRRAFMAAAAALATAFTSAARADDFSFMPPGELVAGSGEGRVDDKVYAPGMRFPMESGPAFANSQVYGAGGSEGPPGGQCDDVNYSYPWRDNYCEIRQWDMPLCPAGTGHQGQDIRAATCEKEVHPVVAAEAGTITNIGSYSVYLTAADGTRFDYLHMGALEVSVGQKVEKGQIIGRVSNEFGGTPTTTHLHFNIRQNVDGLGSVYVPPYLSLVEAYQALIGPVNTPPMGLLDAIECSSISGWAFDPEAAEAPATVRLAFGGPIDDPAATVADLLADRTRSEVCEPLGSCEHGFETALPLSLLDEAKHPVHAYALDGAGGEPVELQGSPKTLECPLDLPPGVLRHVIDEETYATWGFSAFWDQAKVDAATLAALPSGLPLPSAPELVRADDGSPDVWLLDVGSKRRADGPGVAEAWGFDLDEAEQRPADELADIEEGPPVRVRPVLLQGDGPEVYLLDTELSPGSGSDDDGGGALDSSVSCSCRTGAVPSTGLPAVLLVAALALARRRRRSR